MVDIKFRKNLTANALNLDEGESLESFTDRLNCYLKLKYTDIYSADIDLLLKLITVENYAINEIVCDYADEIAKLSDQLEAQALAKKIRTALPRLNPIRLSRLEDSLCQMVVSYSAMRKL